jgi:hypothetical protein
MVNLQCEFMTFGFGTEGWVHWDQIHCSTSDLLAQYMHFQVKPTPNMQSRHYTCIELQLIRASLSYSDVPSRSHSSISQCLRTVATTQGRKVLCIKLYKKGIQSSKTNYDWISDRNVIQYGFPYQYPEMFISILNHFINSGLFKLLKYLIKFSSFVQHNCVIKDKLSSF